MTALAVSLVILLAFVCAALIALTWKIVNQLETTSARHDVLNSQSARGLQTLLGDATMGREMPQQPIEDRVVEDEQPEGWDLGDPMDHVPEPRGWEPPRWALDQIREAQDRPDLPDELTAEELGLPPQDDLTALLDAGFGEYEPARPLKED